MSFDSAKADLVVKFFERLLTHTKGKNYAGRPFILEPWQKKHIRELFGRVDRTGKRQYRTCYWETPKKNGKSEIAAGIALYGLFMDDEPGAEIYSASGSRGQASKVFNVAASMVRNNPDLNALCKIIDSKKTIRLLDDPDSFYQALSADASLEDGANPHFVVFDELHRQKKRDLWDVLKRGMSTRHDPLMFAITTAGIASESPICWDMHEYSRQIIESIFKDKSFYPVLYSLPEDADWTLEENWKKVNPALGTFKSLDSVRDDFKVAIRIPSEQNSFRRFELSQWVANEKRWMDLREWDKGAEPFNAAEIVEQTSFGGLDLSSTQDITAFIELVPQDDEYLLIPQFFMPEENIFERSRDDNVTYDLWAKQGLIHLTPGNVVDYGFVRKTIKDRGEVNEIVEIGYDRWNATEIITNLQDDGFTMVPIGQGFAGMSAPCREFERLVLGARIRHGGNPVLRWMMDCTSVKQDPAGNIKPVKPDRLKSKKRIDGIVATIIALARVIVSPEYKPGYTAEDGLFVI